MKHEDTMDYFRQAFAGSWITQGICVAAELGLADLLASGPQSAEQLACQTDTHPDSLYRLMRALASTGIFSQESDGRFTLTPLSEMLQSDVPDSQRPYATMMGSEFYNAWGELLYSVRTGKPGFEKRFGTKCFEYLTSHPDRHGIYDSAMGAFGKAETVAVLDAYDFSTFGTVVDVGGGSGLLLKAILDRHHTVEGVFFDLLSVAERARSVLGDPNLAGRCRVENGDFFCSVPSGADAYIMQHVIHDWDDAEAITILNNCRKAMRPEARILLIETVLPADDQFFFGKWLDLMMLLVGGRERTEGQYRSLLSAAGLHLSRIVKTANEVSVIEAVIPSLEIES